MSRFARCSNRKAGREWQSLDFTFWTPGVWNVYMRCFIGFQMFPGVEFCGYGAQGKAQEETLRSLQENLHTLNLGEEKPWATDQSNIWPCCEMMGKWRVTPKVKRNSGLSVANSTLATLVFGTAPVSSDRIIWNIVKSPVGVCKSNLRIPLLSQLI